MAATDHTAADHAAAYRTTAAPAYAEGAAVADHRAAALAAAAWAEDERDTAEYCAGTSNDMGGSAREADAFARSARYAAHVAAHAAALAAEHARQAIRAGARLGCGGYSGADVDAVRDASADAARHATRAAAAADEAETLADYWGFFNASNNGAPVPDALAARDRVDLD